MDIMPVGPEIFEYLIGQQPECIQGNQIDNGKGNNHIMAEQGQSENMFIEKHQCKTDETKIQEIKKDGSIGPCPGDLGEIGCLKQNDPGGNDQQQHDNIILREIKIFPVKKVCNIIGKKIGNDRDNDIEYRKHCTFIFSSPFCLGHFRP